MKKYAYMIDFGDGPQIIYRSFTKAYRFVKSKYDDKMFPGVAKAKKQLVENLNEHGEEFFAFDDSVILKLELI